MSVHSRWSGSSKREKAARRQSGHVVRYFLLEGITFSLFGGLTGLLLGGLATLGLRLIRLDLPGLTPTTPTGLSFQPVVYKTVPFLAFIPIQAAFLSLGVVILGGGLASWLVARRAASIQPAVALRGSS